MFNTLLLHHLATVVCLCVCVSIQCQSTLVQFISFLSLQLSADDLVKRLPDIHDLLTSYHIPAEVAFALWRIVYASSISVSNIFLIHINHDVILCQK